MCSLDLYHTHICLHLQTEDRSRIYGVCILVFLYPVEYQEVLYNGNNNNIGEESHAGKRRGANDGRIYSARVKMKRTPFLLPLIRINKRENDEQQREKSRS